MCNAAKTEIGSYSQTGDNALRMGITRLRVLNPLCAGPLLLAKAGLLQGRRFTHGYGAQQTDFLAPYWTGATYEDAACVVDGKIVTAQAWAHIEFAVTVAEMCNALPPGRTADEVRRYYQGAPR